MWAIEAIKLTKGWPNTHHNPHKREAARTAADVPLYAEKNILETIKVISISDLYKYPFLPTVLNNSCSVNI